MNMIIVKGRLTSDPELKNTQSGIAVCGVSLAVPRPRTKDETDFFNVTFWRQTAESVAKYVKKGQEILVSGSMQSETYEKDGVKRTAWKLNADSFEFCGNKESGGSSSPASASTPAYSAKPAPAPSRASDDDGSGEDLPF